MKQLFIKYFLLCVLLISCTVHAQIITTVAGTGSKTPSGDGGQATAAGLGTALTGVCFDAGGNMYIANSAVSTIRKVTPSGIISTFAGNLTDGFSGDGGPATAAQLFGPNEIAADQYGNIYIADRVNSRIRKVDAAGIITTFAGNGSPIVSGDGGPATAAGMHDVGGIATDTAGNVYVGGYGYVRKIDHAGIITRIAGNGTIGHSGDGGPATAASLGDEESVKTDTNGNIYMSEIVSPYIRKIDRFGIISSICGNGVQGYSGDGGPATNAQLGYSSAVIADHRGNVYVTDAENRRVRRIDAAGIITTVAGNGTDGYSGDNDVCGPATSQVYTPSCMAVDEVDNIYFSDSVRVRMIYYDTPPAFAGGHSLHIGGCKDGGAIAANVALAIKDTNAGQGEAWAMLTAPMHGTAVVTYAATATGGTVTPTGLSYTPASGFTGIDSFKVQVKDCLDSADTAMVYVTIDTMPTVAAITGIADTLCMRSTILLSNPTIGGVWATVKGNASVAAGLVTGITAGIDTVHYTITNACSSATAAYAIKVINCNLGITPRVSPTGASMQVTPNPGNGTFSVLLSSPNSEACTITVRDAQGRTIHEATATTNTALPIHLHVPAGIYLLTAQTANARYEERIVVTK